MNCNLPHSNSWYTCCKNLNYILKCFVCFSGRFSVGWTAGTVSPWRISELLRIKQRKSLIRWADQLVIYASAFWLFDSTLFHIWGRTKESHLFWLDHVPENDVHGLKMATHKFIVYIWLGLIKTTTFVYEWWIGGRGHTGPSHHSIGMWSLVGTVTTLSLLIQFYRTHRQEKIILRFAKINKLMHWVRRLHRYLVSGY